jgi:uncharacterized membrane protein
MVRIIQALLFIAVLVVFLSVPATAQEGTGIAAGTVPLDNSVENAVKSITLYLARFAEGAAALVIGIASLRALWAYFRSIVLPVAGQIIPRDEIRLSLGRSLALALEFELGADILKTAVAPTWNEIGQLAAIAVLRTALNYFLERELEHAQDRERSLSTVPPAAASGAPPHVSPSDAA